ncbi:MAG: IS200/IS605 family transposase [Chlamydiales bacterium]|nr:IS200/IS605 family transposase [Chlamydiales bacterium]
MAHTHTNLFFHIVWSTKNREPLLSEEFEKRLHMYLRRSIEGYNGHLLAVNGMPDHIHMLVNLPASVLLAEIMRRIKTGSSKWLATCIPGFGWQIGYGAFSVGHASVDQVSNYINNQKVHHQKMSYAEEYVRFLKIQGIIYDERFVLD